MPPQVWVAGNDDLEPVAELLVAFRDWMRRDAPPDATIRRTTAALLRDSDTDFLLASPDGGSLPAGVCQLRYRLSVWTGTDDCWLEDLYVREDARGGGVGRTLVEAAVERARARRCRRIQLDVNEQNSEALSLYRSAGFSTESKPPGRTLFIGRSL
jgi:ribosomal protein S18 acetylase RimI-like enzyme